jgi:hypothetical protein
MINIKIKADFNEFYDWLYQKVRKNPMSIMLENGEFLVQLGKQLENTNIQISFIGILQEKIEFYEYLDDLPEDEGKEILRHFPEDEILAMGNVIDAGKQGFEIDLIITKPEFKTKLESIIEDIGYLWTPLIEDYDATNAKVEIEKQLEKSGWVGIAVKLNNEGKTAEQIRSELKKQDFEVTTKTIRNELTKQRKILGDNYVLRKNQRDRNIVSKIPNK